MQPQSDYDVAIVGASLAGCTAARLFGLEGLKVALVDQHQALDWHKRICTHYIQACAVPTIRRLGLEPLIERAGGLRSRMEIWTRWGWIRHAPQTPPETYGYSIRRQTLDPLVRQLAVETPGVEPLLGWTAEKLLQDGDRYCGLELRDPSGATREVRARLVVAADGRNSPLAALAAVKTNTQPNNRFTYYAYYRNVALPSGDDSQLWLLDPNVAYALPNEDGITLLCCWLTKDQLPAFREDRVKAFERTVSELPGGPDLSQAQRISDILGAVDLPVHFRTSTGKGLALIGDAACATDPLWGVGCGWAFQSAEWLVDATAPTLLQGGNLQAALGKYRRRHRNTLGGHHMMIVDYARGRRFRALERLFYSAAAKSGAMAELILAFGARRIGPQHLLAPSSLMRALWSQLRPQQAVACAATATTATPLPSKSASEPAAR